MRISGVLVRGPLGIGSAGIRILSPLGVSHVMAALPSRWSRCGEAVAPLAKRLPTRDPSAFLMLPVSPENRVQIAHLVDPPAAAADRPTATHRSATALASSTSAAAAAAAVIDDDRLGIGFCFYHVVRVVRVRSV